MWPANMNLKQNPAKHKTFKSSLKMEKKLPMGWLYIRKAFIKTHFFPSGSVESSKGELVTYLRVLWRLQQFIKKFTAIKHPRHQRQTGGD